MEISLQGRSTKHGDERRVNAQTTNPVVTRMRRYRSIPSLEGIIRAADVNGDYTIRPEPSETVRQLRRLIIWLGDGGVAQI
jgi:hypothetical protein